MHLPHWMIVYGTDRNSGKTTLISQIIGKFHVEVPIVGIKISPHFHRLEPDAIIAYQAKECVIIRENLHRTGKDSSRMLDAGASEVLYVQVWDQDLGKVLPAILGLIPGGSAVICESGWARRLIIPGLFFVLHRKGNTEIKDSAIEFRALADQWIEFDGEQFDFDIREIRFADQSWKLAPNR